MKLLPMLLVLAGVTSVTACGPTEPLPPDPSPYAGPVERYSEPTDGLDNEIGDDS